MKYDPKTEYIVTAWAERAHGPGWQNLIVWVLLSKIGGGELRMEAIQPEEQTDQIRDLFDVCATASKVMTKAAELCLDLQAYKEKT